MARNPERAGDPRRRPRVPAATCCPPGPGLPRISYELYPPRRPDQAEAVWETVRALATTAPQFFSITYPSSAPGRAASRDLVERLLADGGVPAVAHLTVVGTSRAELAARVRAMLAAGVRDFLALRGDPEPGKQWEPHPDGLNRATDLVGLIRRVEADARAAGLLDGEVSVGCAVYPHAHGERRYRELVTMRAKQESGADFAITQVFYDVAEFAALVREAPSAGVSLPILPGIIPLTDPGRLRRLAALSGVEPPAGLVARLDVPDPEERFARGIAATADLVEGTLEAGAPGVHVFTFNQSRPALALHAELRRRGLVEGPPSPTEPMSEPAPSAAPTAIPTSTGPTSATPPPATPTEGQTP